MKLSPQQREQDLNYCSCLREGKDGKMKLEAVGTSTCLSGFLLRYLVYKAVPLSKSCSYRLAQHETGCLHRSLGWVMICTIHS